MTTQSTQPPKQSAKAAYDNLAQCIQQARLARSWSREELSRRTAMPVALIQQLEEGREVFLADAHRPRLASALRIDAHTLKQLEQPHLGSSLTNTVDEGALESARQTHRCPQCQAPLRVAYFDRQDMHGHSVVAGQMTCTQCLFRHRFEMAPTDDGELI